MEQNQLETFKQLFLDIKNHHAGNAIDLGLEMSSTKGGDEVDLVNLERDRELLLKLQGRNRFYLKKIDEALNRIENGTFGECAECGCGIEMNRLQARPTATHCIECKESQERSEGHIPYQKRSHTQGQEIINNVLSFPKREDNATAV
jgi:DnaK suppressor protein